MGACGGVGRWGGGVYGKEVMFMEFVESTAVMI